MTDTSKPKWTDLFGIDPTYDQDHIEEPTFTASELKDRLETATAVALALGRKEALEECASAIENNHGWPTAEQKKALEFAAQIARTLANRNLPSQPAGGGSEPLTASGGHSDLPPTPEVRKKPRCPSCGSERWVSVSLNGGHTRLAQCVPCGAYHKGVIGPGWRSPRFNDPEAVHPDYRDLPEGSDQ